MEKLEQLNLFGEHKKLIKDGKGKQIISVSRRTDIPAFYWDWFKDCIKKGEVEVVNQYNNKPSIVSLKEEDVHSIIFWSKDYHYFLEDKRFLKKYLNKYNLYFQFTITGYSANLEKNIPHYSKTLQQMKELAELYGPECINWRFDPIMFTDKGEIVPTFDRLGLARIYMFENLCKEVSKIGVKRCTISFVTLYKHVQESLDKRGIKVREVPDNIKIKFVSKMVQIAAKYDIQIYSCSNPVLEGIEGIKKSACIDGKVLTDLFGESTSLSKDGGQRKDCGCSKSRDIGDYNKICRGGCKYCYSYTV